MIKKICYQNTFIRYNDTGDYSRDKTIVLLHGYLETLEVWNDISNELSKNYRIIAPDLPGHGETKNTEEIQTMESMADAVFYLLEQLHIKQCYLIGHSMGGYVTLAFAQKYADRLNGFSLFHSSAKNDSEEKKKSRDEQIQLIENGRKEEIINKHAPGLFAKENEEKFQNEIETIKKQALNIPDEGIIAALKGMKERPERVDLLQSPPVPILFIIGKKDNFIPYPVAKEQAELSDEIQAIELENSGHIGFIEEKRKVLEMITDFAGK